MRTNHKQNYAQKMDSQSPSLLKITVQALIVSSLMITLAGGARAQTSPSTSPRDPLIPGASWAPKGTPAPTGSPPPIGSGSTPKIEIQGNASASRKGPPTGIAAPSPGTTRFPVQDAATPTTWLLYRDCYEQPSDGSPPIYLGREIALEIRPRTLNASQFSQIKSLLSLTTDPNTPAVQTAVVDVPTLQHISHILQPTVEDLDYQGLYWKLDSHGRKKNFADPGPGTSLQRLHDASHYTWIPTLPTVKIFCRYLILLGVIAATVWVAIGAAGMIHGYRNAGAAVVQGVAMFMLLLAAFTVYKIVIMNMLHKNTVEFWNVQEANTPEVEDNDLSVPTLPVNPPAVSAGTSRSGVPVIPLYSHGQ